jgi:cell division protein FtsZ
MSENNNYLNIESKSHILAGENLSGNAKIKIVGVGGAGGNAVNRMIKMNITGVDFLAINTDALALEHSLASQKIAIGQKITKSLGAGARPDVGRKAIMEDKDTVAEALKGSDLVFIAAGMGGGTGTGAASVVADIAKSLGILTVAVVSLPFKFEGPVRSRNAANGISSLRESVDTIIVINNQKIMEVIDKTTTTEQAFAIVDQVLGNAVRGVCDIMLHHGNIHVDFNDVRSVMENGGDALMGTGIAEGEDRALRAAENAINCPLLDDVNIEGASGVLVNISHGENFTMQECSTAMEYIYSAVGEANDPSVIFGDITIPELGDKVSITVIATGFGYKPLEKNPVASSPAATCPTDATIAMPKVGAPSGRVVEKATPRPTANFSAMARAPMVEEVVKKQPVAETQTMDDLFSFSSFNESNLDLRTFSLEEEEQTESHFGITESVDSLNTEKMNSLDSDEFSLKKKSVDYSQPTIFREVNKHSEIF